jgi:hypothetical protein
VIAVRVHVLYCEWYVYMFCIVKMECVDVLYCDSGMCIGFVL